MAISGGIKVHHITQNKTKSPQTIPLFLRVNNPLLSKLLPFFQIVMPLKNQNHDHKSEKNSQLTLLVLY